MDFNNRPPDPRSIHPTAPSIIDVGLVKTHTRCLPCDIEFAPYQVDNVMFHFPLPPASKPSSAKHSPADSAIYIHSHENEPREPSKVDRRPKDKRKAHGKRRVKSTIVDIPIRTSSLQPVNPPPPSCGESRQTTNRSTSDINFQQQETPNKLADNTLFEPSASHPTPIDTRCQLADMPPQRHHEARTGPPPTRPAPRRPLQEEINPGFQRSSDALRSRAASLRHGYQLQEQSARPRRINKAQIVLGIQQQEPRSRLDKPAVEEPFDQAVLEFKHQVPPANITTAAAATTTTRKPTQQTEQPIGAHRWASRMQMRTFMNEQPLYTPGSAWRPTAKVHRSVVGGDDGGGGRGTSNITISTPGLANRLGVAVGECAHLRIDAFYDDD